MWECVHTWLTWSERERGNRSKTINVPDILAERAAIRPGEVEQVHGHEAEQGEQIEECPPRTAPVVRQIPNATANEDPHESGKQPRPPIVPAGGGRVKMVIEIERAEVVLGDFVFGVQWRWMVRGRGLARKLGGRGAAGGGSDALWGDKGPGR